MSSSSDQVYKPLPTATSIRVLLLAPGERDDSKISCSLLPSDLDWDHGKFPDSTPYPVESLSFATVGRAGDDDDDGSESTFPIHVDMDFDTGPKARMHPFQRYEALSYVWGDPSDPQHIFFDGVVPFPVTRNLYAALRSLRLPHSGRRLWIDALCMDQSNYEEKKVQLGLMKRVYQQAEKVIAYVPLGGQDQKNISELVPKIFRAGRMYGEERDEREKAGSVPGHYSGPLNSISERETARVATSESEPLSVTLANASRDEKLYLEAFGLPPVDSPLWDSWRRLFTSPYFRRIWIAQEVSLGNNLHICFGDGAGVGAAEPLFLAHHFLDLHSAAMNMSYNAAWCKSEDEEESEGTLRDRVVGSANALTMFRERILVQGGRPRRRLIETLATVNHFGATDLRDKVYALLGWTSDGASFTQHVNYAPWNSIERTFATFAKAFIDRGEGIEVLLQAGYRDEEDGWPSWVPHWHNLEISAPQQAGRGPGKASTRIQVDEGSQALSIPATILDDVEVVNDLVFEKLQVTLGGLSITAFIRTMVRAFLMIFKAFSPRDPEEIFEQLFHVLAQPKTRFDKSEQRDLSRSSPSQDGNDDALDSSRKPKDSSATESQKSEGEDEPDDEETKILRTGFHEFLNYLIMLQSQLSDLEDGMAHLTQHKWRVEYQTFLRRAMATTSHRVLCVTKAGYIGIAPKRTRRGDTVALFEGCDIHFVLRRVEGGPRGINPGEEGGDGGGTATYRLMGPAFFHVPESGGARSPARAVDRITIV
ncbi:HET-domain-containing protein [Nemania sp. NC0429]|nr:HET-domain-containing protein [Nemania sp. NC0429]